MPTHTLADRDTFLEAVRAAGLLTPNQELKAAAITPPGSATDAACVLVAAGLLTRFQTDRLLTGRTDGFQLGQYVILDQVGRGSMSHVYQAKHRTMNRAVAIKVLSAELTRTAEARQTFQREVRTAGKLSHPNIVTAYDANELHDRFYLVLEFVDGPSLDTLVKQRGPLPVDEACEFVRQIAHGLMNAHEQGMVHRDLKPGNVLVARPTPSAPLAVKIADFGIPRLVPGAPDYLAPEQLHNPQAADHRTDLYSLGCVFYFLLTGQSPFASPTAEETTRRLLWEESPRVERLRPDVPAEVAAIVHRLLVKHPVARFASASEVLAGLDAACVPVSMPVDRVSFDLPPNAGYAHDTGYLTGRHKYPNGPRAHEPLPNSGAFAVVPVVLAQSPWVQLTDEVVGDTMPQEPDNTPAPPPHESPKPNRRRESVPLWMTARLLVGVVLLSMMGISVIVRAMVK